MTAGRRACLDRYYAKKRLEKLLSGVLCDLPVYEKSCSRCGEVKRSNFFSTKPTSRDGLHNSCRACNVKAAQKSAFLNPEAVKAHKANWKKNNPEKVKAQGRKDGAVGYRRHHAKRRAYNQVYALANKEKIRARSTSERGRMLRRFNQQKRSARIAKLENTLTKQEWAKRLSDFHGLCAYCPAPGVEIDHIVPVSKGGGLTLANVLPACRPCNTAKNAQDFLVFCSSRGLDAQAILTKASLP